MTRKYVLGIALLEVLIVATLLAIALLGLASMQTSSMKFSHSAYNHTQATYLAQEIVERMRSNRDAAVAGDYAYELTSPGALPAEPNCSDQTCDADEVARGDIRHWGEKVFVALPEASALVRFDDVKRRYDVVIRWQELGVSSPEDTCLQGTADDVACLRLEAQP